MKIGKTRIDVIVGDIAAMDTAAIVTPANDMLWTGSGVSARIHREGGPSIETEALAKAPAAIGSAVATKAGGLKARHVIHAVISGQDLTTDEAKVRAAVRSSLAKADELRCGSLAMPLLDSASFDVEVHVAARIIVDETVNYLLGVKSALERIVFVEDEENLRGLIDTVLREKFTRR